MRAAAILPAPLLLGACNFEVLFPAGDVARQEAHLLAISTVLMLLIIIPVMALTVLFAWRYRQSNKEAKYSPDWDHSTALELVIWSAPLLIIIALGAITWITTHTLDPYRRLDRIAPGKPIAAETKPLEIDVVALDWKWLFIYPEQGVATINELALPVDREVRFRLTASSVMNSFYVPALAGQVYAMPAMETKLHAVLNKPGTYKGISANYSGAGFSGMHFQTIGMDQAGFDSWVAAQKSAGMPLDRSKYLELEKPSEKVPVMRFGSVDPDLFRRAVEMCVAPGKTCMSETMKMDMSHLPAHGEHAESQAADAPAMPHSHN
ncbi:MAG: ubiquinol oxidase subunit II [Sphingomonas sp.]|nr:MAG: ubiquinol oxidase subunit II [Sphingomonas sp.]